MIDDLSTYELVHFLPFTQEVYDRLFTLHNEAWWPAQFVALLVALLAGFAAARERPRVVAGLLGASWAFVALSFFVGRLSDLLWAAPWIAALFGLQAVLLVAARDRLEVVRPRVAAVGLLVVVLGWALLTPAFGRPWSGAEVFAMTPDPTALGTIAVLLGANRKAWFLWPIPVVWCVLSAATSHALKLI